MPRINDINFKSIFIFDAAKTIQYPIPAELHKAVRNMIVTHKLASMCTLPRVLIQYLDDLMHQYESSCHDTRIRVTERGPELSVQVRDSARRDELEMMHSQQRLLTNQLPM